MRELSKFREFKKDGTAWKTIWGKIGKTKFSMFYYKTAMKIQAIGDRGTKRDFIDLYFLSKKFSLEEMFDLYDKKYGDLKEKSYHLLRSLDYFGDAKDDPIPKMIKKVNWIEVKNYFHTESIKLSKKIL